MLELREKLATLLGGKLNGKLVALTALVAVAAIAILTSLNAPKPYRLSPSPTSVAGNIVSAKIFVHVVGMVEHPGIYELESGARLYEAIFAAGGMTKKADQASVNLARQVTDGEQIVVTDQSAVSAAGSGSTPAGALISLNRANQTELETLPRVGPALAARIIDWRTNNGGFKNKKDLMKVSGIGPKLYAGIEKLVTL